MKRNTILLIFISLCAHASWAITVEKNNAVYSEDLKFLANGLIAPIILSRPLVERSRLSNVKIIAIANFHIPHMAVAVPGNHPSIRISDGFIDGLHRYVEAFWIEKVGGQEHFREWYFNYYLWRASLAYEGEKAPKTPLEWSGYKPNDQQKFDEITKLMFSAALIDVVLHELGHHATNSFYTNLSSSATKKHMESNADNWASNAALNYVGDSNVIGRFVALGYIHELERWTKTSSLSSHPSAFDRISNNLDLICDNNNKQIELVCELLYEEITSYNADGYNESNYRARIANGEAYAHYPLANILTKQGLVREACKHYEQALKAVPYALLHVGWCVQYGHAGIKNSELQNEIALIYYDKAAEVGFVEGRKRAEHLRKSME